MSAYINEANETKKVVSDVYLKNNNKIRKLTHESIYQYISAISLKMDILNLDIDKLVNNIYPKLKRVNTMQELDEQIITCATEMVVDHYNYPKIAVWLLINELEQTTSHDFLKVTEQLYNNINKKGKHASIISDSYYNFVKKHYLEINSMIDYERDYKISIFGLRTLEKAYLKKQVNGQLIERPQHMYMRVAIALHYRENRLDRAFESYELMSRGYFTHATPTLFNAGTTREQLASCFLLGIEDDMEAIGDCWKDSAILSKHAGGLGINVSNIRIDGAYINSTQGTASGMKLLTVFNQIARYADQGGKRAGSIAIYLEPWHADIHYYLDLKKHTGAETERARDLFLALMINDLFMERVENDGVWSLCCPNDCPNLLNKYGEEFNKAYLQYEKEGLYVRQIKARDLWYNIMETQIETGVPYIVFKDATNKKSNQRHLGVINGSNLCVSGDTMILTSVGYKNIKSLEDKEIEVWNGEEFSKVIVKKTGTDQELLEIEFSNGSNLKCTAYHKFHITSGYRHQKSIIIEARDLKKGDKLIKSEYPIINKGKNDFKYPYTHGLFCADGTYSRKNKKSKQCEVCPDNGDKYCKKHNNHYKMNDNSMVKNPHQCQAMTYVDVPMIALYGEKQELVAYLDFVNYGKLNNEDNKINIRLYGDISSKYKVPINYDLDIKLRWLEGLLDGDGCICKNDTNISLQITSINKKFLNKVKNMLQTMGCDPKVTLSKKEKQTLLPDGKGGKKLYDTQDCYRLIIHSVDTYTLVNLGLNPKRLVLKNINKPQRHAAHFIEVVNITKLSLKEDTYCFNEPKKHMGIFNGIIAGNCAEIALISSAEEYSVCTLSSICLPKFCKKVNENMEFDYQKLYQVSRVVCRNLDNIIDLNYYPIKKTWISNSRHRPIGIGVQGLADVFALFKTSFVSPLAKDLNKKIFETIYFGAMSESIQLAKEKGIYETFEGSPLSNGEFQYQMWGLTDNDLSGMWDWSNLRQDLMKYGARNSELTTCMPTASTAQILGNNEGCEAYTENIYTRSTLAGDYYVINKHLMKDLIKLNLWDQSMIDYIKYYDGSIDQIPNIPQHIKEIYRTVWEIPQKYLIDMDADRGAFVTMTQSSNRFIAKPTFAKLNSTLFYAWKKQLKTGMYYLRSKAPTGANQFGIDINKIKEIQASQIQELDERPCKIVPAHLRKPGDCSSCGA